MIDQYLHTFSAMGTVVTIHVIGHGVTAGDREKRLTAVERAAGWFDQIEQCCTRFDASSEVSRLAARVGEAVQVSDMLFEAVHFAVAVARESNGAFDPTVGRRMEALGFDREYKTGARVATDIDANAPVNWRDVGLDDRARTITLRQPLLLDLGAVAKGLAVDMAARELEQFGDFAVNAGGDLYLGGHNIDGRPWSVGIRHPREEEAVIETLHVSDTAVCTSGDYERTNGAGGHHILDPRSGMSAAVAASVTVLAPSAMVADALGTAAFVLGPSAGLELLERHGVQGLIITPMLDRFATDDMTGER